MQSSENFLDNKQGEATKNFNKSGNVVIFNVVILTVNLKKKLCVAKEVLSISEIPGVG